MHPMVVVLLGVGAAVLLKRNTTVKQLPTGPVVGARLKGIQPAPVKAQSATELGDYAAGAIGQGSCAYLGVTDPATLELCRKLGYTNPLGAQVALGGRVIDEVRSWF